NWPPTCATRSWCSTTACWRGWIPSSSTPLSLSSASWTSSGMRGRTSMTNARTIFRINASMRGNQFIYWLGRLPLLRRLFTDHLYSAEECKSALFILPCLWWLIKALAGKLIYLAACLPLSASLALGGPQDLLSPNNFGAFCWAFLWFSFLVGTL